MLVSCWGVKGGSGCTVVAAMVAARLARCSVSGALLVDLSGDADAVLGCAVPSRSGVASLLGAGAAAAPGEEVDVGEGLALLPRGEGPLDPDRLAVLEGLLGTEPRPVVVDCGTLPPSEPAPEVAAAFAGRQPSLLVTRPCFLALRRAVRARLRPSGVVLVDEPGRAMGRRDVESVLGVPVVAEVPYDLAVGRAVDAGVLLQRAPKALIRATERLVLP